MNFKLLFTQCLITSTFLLFSCLVFIEAPPRIANSFSRNKHKCENIFILDTLFLYGSCPNNTYRKEPGPDFPAMIPTISCTDSIGGRIDCAQGTKLFNRDNYDTYLIGDSFIQADELIFSKTVAGLINSSKMSPYSQAYSFGYASWNTRQYLQSIKAINKKSSNYDIYLFANDITPSNLRSVYGEINSQTLFSDSNNINILHDLERFARRSVTLRTFTSAANHLFYLLNLRERRNSYWKQHRIAKFNKCPSPSTQDNIDAFSPLARDYIIYSYPYTCWDDIHKEAYSLVKNDLSKILNHGELLKSNVRIILFPPGFSFFQENTPGRLHTTYSIPDDVRLTLYGLRAKLSQDFPNNLFDLEDHLLSEINHFKRTCTSDCENAYYFGHDGHFTARSHSFLFKTLYLN